MPIAEVELRVELVDDDGESLLDFEAEVVALRGAEPRVVKIRLARPDPDVLVDKAVRGHVRACEASVTDIHVSGPTDND